MGQKTNPIGFRLIRNRNGALNGMRINKNLAIC